MSEIVELQKLREQLILKLGQEYVIPIACHGSTHVNDLFRFKVAIKQPDPEVVYLYLTNLAGPLDSQHHHHHEECEEPTELKFPGFPTQPMPPQQNQSQNYLAGNVPPQFPSPQQPNFPNPPNPRTNPPTVYNQQGPNFGPMFPPPPQFPNNGTNNSGIPPNNFPPPPHNNSTNDTNGTNNAGNVGFPNSPGPFPAPPSFPSSNQVPPSTPNSSDSLNNFVNNITFPAPPTFGQPGNLGNTSPLPPRNSAGDPPSSNNERPMDLDELTARFEALKKKTHPDKP